MPLRLIESIVPVESLDVFDSFPENGKVVDRWNEMLDDNKALVRMLVDSSVVEKLVDGLVDRFSGGKGFG